MKLILDIPQHLFLSFRCTNESLNSPAYWKAPETDSENSKAQYVDQNISYISRVVRRSERNKISGLLWRKDIFIGQLSHKSSKSFNSSLFLQPLLNSVIVFHGFLYWHDNSDSVLEANQSDIKLNLTLPNRLGRWNNHNTVILCSENVMR